MPNFLKQITTKQLRAVLLHTFERMPLPMVFSGMVFALSVVMIAVSDLSTATEQLIGKSIITLIVMFFLSIAVYLYTETAREGRVRAWRNQLFTLGFGGLFYYFFEENLFDNFYAESVIYIAMIVVGVLAAVFIAPFILQLFTKRAQQREFYIFGYNTLLHAIMAAIVGNVVFILGAIAWWSITTLFGVEFSDMYAYLSAFTLSVLAPVFFLSQVPSVQVDASQRVEDGKFFGFLIKYIGLPAIVFYFVILYLYSAKVLLNFSQWPHGEVAWMVIGFSFFGYLMYVASYVFEGEFKPARIFRQWFPLIVLPQTLMLFYAIGLRIAQYDVTINRYLVVAFGIWLVLISLHFVFSRGKYLGVIPLGMILFVLVASVGPWSVYSYPEARQLANLESNLIEAQILESSGKVTPLSDKSAIGAQLSGEIYEGIEYMCNKHGCDALRPLLGEQMSEALAKDIERFEKDKLESLERQAKMMKSESDAEILEIYKSNKEGIQESEYTPMRNWAMVQALTEGLGVERYDTWGRDNSGVARYKTFTAEDRGEAVAVKGYDYYVQLNTGKPFMPEPLRFNSGEDLQVALYEAALDLEQQVLIVRRAGEVVESITLRDELAAILSGDKSALTFVVEGKSLQVKVVLYDITVPNPQWVEDVSVPAEERVQTRIYGGTSAYGYALIKE